MERFHWLLKHDSSAGHITNKKYAHTREKYHKTMAAEHKADTFDDGVAAAAPSDADDGDAKTTLGKMGYGFKLGFLQMTALSSPKVIPSSLGFVSTRKKEGRRKKVYATLVSSEEGLCLSDDCQSVHLPLNGSAANLSYCRRRLFDQWTIHAKQLLQACGRGDAPLRTFDLKNLGLRLICCPDPRPDAWLKAGSPIRITHALVEEDNMLASRLLMADCGWDLTQVKDVFGPVLVLSQMGLISS